MQQFHAISISHQHADLHLIGNVMPCFASETEKINAHLTALKEKFGFEEFFFLNTCNRILCIYIADNPLSSTGIKALFTQLNPAINCIDSVLEKLDIFNGVEVLEHLFKVASGMNSMVVGEHEILGQVKKAYKYCRTQNWIGDNLRLLFEYAIPYAKKIYHNTDIGKHTISVVALAMERLKYFDKPESKKIIILGAGESIQKVMRFLVKMGFENISIFNRTLEKAQHLAKLCNNGKAHTLSDLQNYNEGFDVLISCIDQKANLINVHNYPQLLNEDSSKKILIDLAVPNNLSPDLPAKFPIEYIDVESLRLKADANLEKRKLSLTDAEAMIAEQIEEFQVILQKRKLERALSAIPTEMKRIKSHALETVFEKDLKNTDEATRALIEKMLTYVEKKYISIPMTMTRDAIFEEISK